jgi:5-methylcytosine-specific restriction endonuclease McrA
LGKKAYCKECQKASVTANYRNESEKKKAYQRRHRKLNLERVRESDIQRYERDKDKRISLVENQIHKRRARRNQVPFEEGISRIALRKRHGDHCVYCRIELNFVRAKNRVFTKRDATIEHRLPLARGGKHVWENVVLACRTCNMSKGAKTEEEFMVYRAEIRDLSS